jgi:glutamine amidotransferase
MLDVAICDVGLGNLRSVERALTRAAGNLGLEVRVGIEANPEALRKADKVVMPGQGAFRDCAQALGSGLGDVIRERIAEGVPYLGICLGLQVLFGSSEEAAGCRGLGLFPGEVVRLEGGHDPLSGTPLKIPHMGWNAVEARGAPSLLGSNPDYYYFVHSFAVRPTDEGIVAGYTTYGARFVSAIAHDNVFACQFHPEKSQRAGVALLERFLAL